MTVEEKFNQILAILPEDGSSISVYGAPLCPNNDWIEHTLRTIFRSETSNGTPIIRYRTMGDIGGKINIYADYDRECYRDDVRYLYNWMKSKGFFGYFDKNLF